MDHPGWFPKLCVCYMFSYVIRVVAMLKNRLKGFLKLLPQSLAGKLLHFFFGGGGRVWACPVNYYQRFFPATSTAQHSSSSQLLHSPSRPNSGSLHTVMSWPPLPSRDEPWDGARVRSKGWALISQNIFLIRFGGLVNEANKAVSGK